VVIEAENSTAISVVLLSHLKLKWRVSSKIYRYTMELLKLSESLETIVGYNLKIMVAMCMTRQVVGVTIHLRVALLCIVK